LNAFLVLQICFDGVLLFGILFLFHFSVNQTRKKREDTDLLKNLQVQEMKENLQELLMTLKQLGQEVSENIQEQVREAEEKTEAVRKISQKLHRDLQKATALAQEVAEEKSRLEDKREAIQTAKRASSKQPTSPLAPPAIQDSMENSSKPAGKKRVKSGNLSGLKDELPRVGLSSERVKEVYRLVDEQMDLNAIMDKTGLSRAEVQLILNLRGNRFTTPN